MNSTMKFGRQVATPGFAVERQMGSGRLPKPQALFGGGHRNLPVDPTNKSPSALWKKQDRIDSRKSN